MIDFIEDINLLSNPKNMHGQWRNKDGESGTFAWGAVVRGRKIQ